MKKILLMILIAIFLFLINTSNIYGYIDASSEDVNLEISNEQVSCTELLGPNITKLVHAGVIIMQVVGCILTVVMGMIKLIPVIMSKDANGLKKVSGELVKMAIILLIILMLPWLSRLLGKILGFDISCLV